MLRQQPFTVVAYNLLAQSLIRPKHHGRNAPPESSRAAVAARQLLDCFGKPDVVCLQECTSGSLRIVREILSSSSDHHDSATATCFSNEMVTATSFPTNCDGSGRRDFDANVESHLATVWNPDRFKLVGAPIEVCHNVIRTTRAGKQDQTELTESLISSHNVSLVTNFVDVTDGRKLIVANVHIDFRLSGDETESLQLVQLAELAKALRDLQSQNDAASAVIIAGDMNTENPERSDEITFRSNFAKVRFDLEEVVEATGAVASVEPTPLTAAVRRAVASARTAAGPRWLDHILFTPSSLALTKKTTLPWADEFPQPFCLSESIPSDHVPIGVQFVRH